MNMVDHPLSGPVYTDKGKQKAPAIMRKGPRSPSLCWWCLRSLMAVPGEKGQVFFNLVIDKGGVEHRVHGSPCTQSALDDGNKLAEGTR